MDNPINTKTILQIAAERVLGNICGGRLAFVSDPEPFTNRTGPLEPGKNGYPLDNHRHPEIAQVVQGRARLKLSKGQVDLTTNKSFFIMPQTIHGETFFQPDTPYTLLWMVIYPTGINFFLSGYKESRFYVLGQRYLMDVPVPNHIWEVGDYRDLGTNILKRARIHEHLIHACRQVAENAGDRINDTEGYHQKLSEQIRNYIDLHYAQAPHIEELARIARCSPNHLNTLFRKYIGVPIHQYVLQQRLQEAHRLLHQSHITAKEVAYRLGFSDPLYFSRIFRKHFSVPPSKVLREGKMKRQELL